MLMYDWCLTCRNIIAIRKGHNHETQPRGVERRNCREQNKYNKHRHRHKKNTKNNNNKKQKQKKEQQKTNKQKHNNKKKKTKKNATAAITDIKQRRTTIEEPVSVCKSVTRPTDN